MEDGIDTVVRQRKQRKDKSDKQVRYKMAVNLKRRLFVYVSADGRWSAGDSEPLGMKIG